MVSSSMVVGVLIHCALLFSLCDLKAVQMSLQYNLIWELILYKFELCYALKITKNICYAKGEGTLDHSTVTSWFKKLPLCCKNLCNQADLKLWILRPCPNPERQIWWVELKSISRHLTVWFVTFTTLAKAAEAAELCLMLAKYCKIFYSLLYINGVIVFLLIKNLFLRSYLVSVFSFFYWESFRNV